jgi:hypothetical protein
MKLRMVSHATIALDLSLAVSAPSLPAASRVLQVLAAHQAQVRVRMLAGTTVWLSQSHPEDGVWSVCPSVASKDGDGQHRHYAMAAASSPLSLWTDIFSLLTISATPSLLKAVL